MSAPAPVLLLVTVAATRRPVRGDAGELRSWADQLCSAAARRPGFLGSRVVTGPSGVTTTLTFTDAAAAAGWERCTERATLLARAEQLTDGAPSTPGPARPVPRWRTAAVVWAGLFPFSLLYGLLAGPVVAGLPVVLQSLASSAVLVPLAVHVGIPTVNAVLRRFS